MLLITTALAAMTLGTAINAQILADRIPNKRTALSAGGWALTAPAGTCPASTTSCNSGWCCPGSLACTESGSEDISSLCCPGCEFLHSKLLTPPLFDVLSFAHPFRVDLFIVDSGVALNLWKREELIIPVCLCSKQLRLLLAGLSRLRR
jgi:hypothetical protein